MVGDIDYSYLTVQQWEHCFKSVLQCDLEHRGFSQRWELSWSGTTSKFSKAVAKTELDCKADLSDSCLSKAGALFFILHFTLIQIIGDISKTTVAQVCTSLISHTEWARYVAPHTMSRL